jgi:peptidoglycan glycosyltransferase
MNRPIRVMAISCLVLFLALMVNVNYLQYIAAEDLNDRGDNRRVVVDEYSRKRGDIVVAGESVARSRKVDDQYEYLRRYSEPELYANLTGYYSFQYGSAGLENSQNLILSGNDSRLFVDRVVDLVSSDEPEGGSVELTIDPAAQRAAYQGLLGLGEGTRGAVVALDPQTGAVLAMVSTPSYNPNRLASHDFESVEDYYERLTKDPDKPNLDRSRRDVYAPGSTFKLVTAAAALSEEELGLSSTSMVEAGPTQSFPDGGSYQLTNQSNTYCGAERVTMITALAASCNVVFGKLGVEVGAEALAAQAERFGFGDDNFLDDLTVVPSRFSTEDPETLNGPQTAQSAIGQFDVAVTPLQMAMVVAGIANNGTVMKPYVVDRTYSPEATVLDETDPEALTENAVSPEVAQELTTMMVGVVEEPEGTASSLAIDGATVGGKTGTAERGEEDNPYAWMVGFAAPAEEDPQVAVAVLVQDASGVARDDISGGRLAGPIAKAVMEAVIRR